MRGSKYLGLSRTGRVFIVRVAVPKPLRAALGRKEVRRTLRPDTPLHEARRLALAIGTKLASVFQQIMSQQKKHPPGSIGLIVEHVLRGPEGALEAKGVTIDPANYEADVAALQHLLGVPTSAAAPAAPATPKTTWPDLVRAYAAEQTATGNWSARSADEILGSLRAFTDWCAGQTPPADPLKKDTCTAYKTHLLATRAARTAGKLVVRLSAACNWGVNHGLLTASPWQGLKIRAKTGPSRDDRDPYTSAEVNALLAVLDPAADGRHWLPLLGLYTGARIGELAQLGVADVFDAPLPHISINADDDPKKHIKTPGSRRLVPLHSAIASRFLEHVDGLRKAGEVRVFPAFPADKHGYAHSASHWFYNFRKARKLNPVFHQLRHSFIDRLKEAEVSEDVVADAAGHSSGKTLSFKTYAKAASLERVSKAIELLPGLDGW
jgi:integrase